eukprot:3067410-Karenia_brevis.AAC.1
MPFETPPFGGQMRPRRHNLIQEIIVDPPSPTTSELLLLNPQTPTIGRLAAGVKPPYIRRQDPSVVLQDVIKLTDLC